MTMRARLTACVVLMTAAGLTASAHKFSDPVGVYCLIDHVTLEPNDAEPQMAQIWGAFAVSDGKPGNSYLTPAAGYFYFTCAKGRETVCANEWMDLKSLSGKMQLSGFGSRYGAVGRLRLSTEKAASPDVYPIAMGVFRSGNAFTDPTMLESLKKVLRSGKGLQESE
jgi:hypothetical protein